MKSIKYNFLFFLSFILIAIASCQKDEVPERDDHEDDHDVISLLGLVFEDRSNASMTESRIFVFEDSTQFAGEQENRVDTIRLKANTTYTLLPELFNSLGGEHEEEEEEGEEHEHEGFEYCHSDEEEDGDEETAKDVCDEDNIYHDEVELLEGSEYLTELVFDEEYHSFIFNFSSNLNITTEYEDRPSASEDPSSFGFDNTVQTKNSGTGTLNVKLYHSAGNAIPANVTTAQEVLDLGYDFEVDVDFVVIVE